MTNKKRDLVVLSLKTEHAKLLMKAINLSMGGFPIEQEDGKILSKIEKRLDGMIKSHEKTEKEDSPIDNNLLKEMNKIANELI